MILAISAVAAAEETPTKAVLITRDGIDLAARATVKHPPPTFEIDLGELTFRNRFGRASLAYLPFLRTLPYTFPSPNWSQFPNAFELTNTPMAWRP
jgi:hypothetical protein